MTDDNEEELTINTTERKMGNDVTVFDISSQVDNKWTPVIVEPLTREILNDDNGLQTEFWDPEKNKFIGSGRRTS